MDPTILYMYAVPGMYVAVIALIGLGYWYANR
jgi:hypothetical protein